MTGEELTEDELQELDELVSSATPGPWYVKFLDDDAAMNLVVISTSAEWQDGERWPHFDHAKLIAATLVQRPRYIDIADGRWDENAQFIARSRELVPRLLAEVKRLRAEKWTSYFPSGKLVMLGSFQWPRLR